MARNRNSASPAAAVETAKVRAPSGFRDLGSVQAEAWFALKEGNVLQGKLLGMYQMRDDRSKKPGAMKNFFQIEVTEPGTIGRYGTGENAVEQEAPVGAVLNLNYGVKTQVLETLITNILNNGVYYVWIHCGKKISLRNNNSMWDIRCKSQQMRAPMALAPSELPDFADDDSVATGSSASDSDDDSQSAD
jgi:hypothetical protein